MSDGEGQNRGKLRHGGSPKRPIDPIFPLVGWNAAMGAGLGALFTLGLIWFDAARIATLASRQGIEPIAYLLLFVAFMALGGGVMVASAIMMQRADDGTSDGGGHRARNQREDVRASGEWTGGARPLPVRSGHRDQAGRPARH